MGGMAPGPLGQVAAQAKAKDVSQMTPEELAAYVAQLQAANPTPPPTPAPSPAPTPAPAAQAPSPSLWEMLLNKILPSTKSLAKPMPTGGITAEELWKQQHPGQPYPGTPGQ